MQCVASLNSEIVRGLAGDKLCELVFNGLKIHYRCGERRKKRAMMFVTNLLGGFLRVFARGCFLAESRR